MKKYDEPKIIVSTFDNPIELTTSGDLNVGDWEEVVE